MTSARKLAGYVVLAMLLISSAVIFSVWALKQIEAGSEARTNTFMVLNKAGDLLSALKDAETGQRGYLLTGEERYLEPYLAVRDTIDDRVQALRQLSQTTDGVKKLDAMALLIRARLLLLFRTIEMRRRNELDAAIAAVRGGEGKTLMDAIRIQMSAFIEIEEAALRANETALQKSLRRVFSMVFFTAFAWALFAVVLIYYNYQRTQSRVRELVHVETRHLLAQQEGISQKLETLNALLFEREARLAVTLDSIGDAVIATDANAKVTVLNPVAEKLTGWLLSEASGRGVEECFRIVNKESRKPVDIPVMAALAHGTLQGLANHTVLISRDGREYDIADSCAPIRDTQGNVVGAVLVFRDVTVEYAVRDALGASEARMRLATAATSVGLWDWNLANQQLRWTPEMFRIYGITPTEDGFVSYALWRASVLHEDLVFHEKALQDTLRRGGQGKHVFRIRRADTGEIRDIESVHTVRNNARREPEWLVGTHLDITERMLADDKLRLAMELADKANLAKSDFLSSMSHELRTPLSAILGFAQLLDSGTPSPTPSQKRSIGQILQSGWYLLELINEILDLALIESGKLSLSLEPLALGKVLQECQAMIEPQAQKRGIVMSFIQQHEAYFVGADRTRLKQVIINLLSNAIKYNRVAGSVVVRCTAMPNGRIRISFEDTGEGLSTEHLAQLFQPFNRLGQEFNAEEGTGIGLVVCKRLVELMGGAIGAESTVGEGSIFWIELRQVAETKNAVDRSLPITIAAGLALPEDSHLQTLLYVEDNPANLMLVEDLIARRPDLRFLSARDGNSGVAMARAALPDVIVMDINLPGISGLKALRILSDDPATTHIPIIALSANAMPRDIEKGLEAGFFRYLTKPIKIDEFMRTLDDALKISRDIEAD